MEGDGKKCSSQNASFVSKLLFLWTIPLFKKGLKQDLMQEDLYTISSEDESKKLGDAISKKWEAEVQMCKKSTKKPSLVKVLLSCFGREYLPEFCIIAVNMWVFRIVQPIYLKLLIRSFSEENGGNGHGYDKVLYASIISLMATGNVLCLNRNLFVLSLIGMKCQVSCSSLIFRKILKLNKIGEGKTTVGQMVNLLSSDVKRFNRELYSLQFLIIAPVQLAICTFLLWRDLGFSCLAGLVSILMLIPVQYCNGRLALSFRKRIAGLTDERGRIISEIINSMRVIKMYAWEKPFSALVALIRRSELNVQRKRAFTLGMFSNFHALTYKILPFSIILTSTLSGYNLTADIVFNVVLICTIINYSLVMFLNASSIGLGEIHASVQRIERFLMLEEFETDSNANPENGKEPAIVLDSASANWVVGSHDVLSNLAVGIKGNTLAAVVGPVGSGKSSLLQHLLGEMPFSTGKKYVYGKIAYASQEAWIFDGTVKQNIVFGSPFDQTRYDEVTKATSLVEDFEKFPYGDLSRVGERGIILSGGQKARIGLARALYYKADIYLLDDPLSAVDSIVGKHLFEECLKKFLKGKITILVTHQLKYLFQVDHIILLETGKIACQGSYQELQEQGIDFLKFLAITDNENSEKDKTYVSEEILVLPRYEMCETTPQEKKQSGSVPWKTCWEYINSGDSTLICLTIIVSMVVYQISMNGIDVWLLKWTNAVQLQNVRNKVWNETVITDQNTTSETPSYYLGMYGGLVAATGLIGAFRSIAYYTYILQICKNIHDKMLNSVMRAPAKFFDDNPSGRLLNRFTKDIGLIDEVLPSTFYDVFTLFFRVMGVVVVVIFSNYFMIIPSIGIFIILWFVRKFYINTSKDVRRIEGIVKSPVFTHITETFQGLTTIRAFGAEDRVTQQFDSYQDVYSCAWYTFLTTSRCFGVWIETISLAFVIAVTFSFIVLTSSTMGGNVGLAISSALSLASAIQNGLRQSAEAESSMMAVERTMEYSKLTPEAPHETPKEKQLPEKWPQNGHIRFENVSLSYGDSTVLKNISFEILPKEKVGIVGRTGAGKSSIIQSLFRMTEPQGDIFIDDVRVNDIGLHDLRKSVSIIPQDPVLFSGTFRYNLDPFEQFPDDELWSVINQVELGTVVQSLDFKVSNGGNNFSVGQKQLICLARAILRKNKIIIMDEATANVDHRTDDLIQQTIREKFSECTIITIAHRLNSVIDSDKILMIDSGEIKECGPPSILLQNPQSLFSTLVKNSAIK